MGVEIRNSNWFDQAFLYQLLKSLPNLPVEQRHQSVKDKRILKFWTCKIILIMPTSTKRVLLLLLLLIVVVFMVVMELVVVITFCIYIVFPVVAIFVVGFLLLLVVVWSWWWNGWGDRGRLSIYVAVAMLLLLLLARGIKSLIQWYLDILLAKKSENESSNV